MSLIRENSLHNRQARDGFSCQYCGRPFPMPQLNYDHVTPRSRGGKTNWENIVTSCLSCNARKGSRTCEEAGMPPIRKPAKPVSLPIVAIRMDLSSVPASWRDYWYWNVGLQP